MPHTFRADGKNPSSFTVANKTWVIPGLFKAAVVVNQVVMDISESGFRKDYTAAANMAGAQHSSIYAYEANLAINGDRSQQIISLAGHISSSLLMILISTMASCSYIVPSPL